MKRVIYNRKGGVGKTSLACNIAAAMAQAGRKVLVVDLDPQANSSHYLLGREVQNVTRTVADFFSSTLSFRVFKDELADSVYRTKFDGLFVIPAEESLEELQPKLESRYKIFKLAEAIDNLIKSAGFDEVIIDTPPARNFYSVSALMAADRVLIPFDCDAFSTQAISTVMETVEEVIADHKPELKIEGVIVNQFQKNARLPLEAVQLVAAMGVPVLKPYISHSIAMKESHQKNIPVCLMKPNHRLAQEFKGLTEQLMEPRQNSGRGANIGGVKKDPGKSARNLHKYLK